MTTARFAMMFDVDGKRELSVSDDVFIQMHVATKLQKYEHELYTVKWFDYRRMTPVQATVEYIRKYAEIHKIIYARDIDYKRARFANRINAISLFAALARGDKGAKRKLSGYWRGRQVADALGMPYDLYIEQAFNFRMRRWARAYMPQPEHLYHEYDVEKIQAWWEEMQAADIILPKDPAYLVSNFQGIPYQNDFHEYLFKQVAARHNEAENLADLIEQNYLPIDKVAARVDSEVYARVESYL